MNRQTYTLRRPESLCVPGPTPFVCMYLPAVRWGQSVGLGSECDSPDGFCDKNSSHQYP